ncbi:MAG TPA: lytic transglycosylase domain-containing protein, partial [Candidatus Bathyarchaeia archaeon]|nr:lytic transglycosylase domain-containing protein [Candidatus Bathyarchaeia archaeon]
SGNAAGAKETITSALLGLILGLCAWIILAKINPDLVNMRGITQITGGGISGQTPLVSGVVGNYTAVRPNGDKATATMAYIDLIKKYAAEKRIPENIAFGLFAQEGGGNPRAVSPVGALGLGQLMPATAATLGVSDPFNPEQNIKGSLTYLKQMYDATGSWDSANAAYNCGLTRFKSAATWENLPAETKAHVPAVMGYANWYSQQNSQGAGVRVM